MRVISGLMICEHSIPDHPAPAVDDAVGTSLANYIHNAKSDNRHVGTHMNVNARNPQLRIVIKYSKFGRWA